MFSIITSILIGFVAGFLGGQFGVGGGLITQPAIRLLLHKPALIAVGTPLPIILPTALAALFTYRKNNLIDYKKGITIGLVGAVFSILGAFLTPLIGGSVILLATSIIITLVSLRYFLPKKEKLTLKVEHPVYIILTGVFAGFFSGLLGLGGGFVIIPALTILVGMEIKKAFGTSLLAIVFLAIPGSITHLLLGNVDLKLALLITIGVIPGAYIGSRVTISLPSKVLNLLFGLYLLINALFLAINELFFVGIGG